MWFCPTYQRPDRLRELADSWEKYESSTPLQVRVWSNDPRKAEYFAQQWPASWTLYESHTESFSAACNEFFERNPDESFYGFIADDVVLTGPGGLDHLAAVADPVFIAYPNDTIQRHAKPTHFAIGGDLARLLGWFVPPFLQHLYTDDVLKALGESSGLLRYVPHVVFYHKHAIAGRADADASYLRFYDVDGKMSTPDAQRDYTAYTQYMHKAFATDVRLIRSMLLYVENAILKGAGIEPSTVHYNEAEPVLQTRDVRGGVGGRERAGSAENADRSVGGVHWAGDPDALCSTVQRADSKAGGGFPQGGCPWVIEPREYKYPDAKVVIAVPSSGEWKSGMGASLALMMVDFAQYGLPGLRSRSLHLNSTESSMLVSNRHNAVKKMLQVGGTHLLFVDSDMKFPAWMLRRLMSHDLPIVAANCVRRFFPVEGTAKDMDGNPVDSRGKTGLEKVRQVGGAVMLIRRDVLEKIKPPYFLMDWLPDLQGYCGEDIYFCQLAQAHGFDVWVDHDLSPYIGHVGSHVFGHGQIGHEVPPWMPGAVAVES